MQDKKAMSKKDLETLGFIKSHIMRRGFPPTRNEVAEHFGIYPNAAHGRIMSLVKKDKIILYQGVSRGLQLVAQ